MIVMVIIFQIYSFSLHFPPVVVMREQMVGPEVDVQPGDSGYFTHNDQFCPNGVDHNLNLVNYDN